MPINFYIWSGAFSFVAVSGIGFFVLTRDSQKETNRIFCLFALSVACWAVGSFLGNILKDTNQALWVMRINYLAGVWVPTLYVLFIYILSGKLTPAKLFKIKFFETVSGILSILVFTPFFIPALQKIRGYAFYISKPGPVYYVFFAFFTIAMSEVIYQTFQELRRRSGLEYRQFKFVAAANVLAIMAGFEYFLRVFGFLSSPPLDDYILVVYAFVLAYAVTRHRLLDIDALVRAFRKERLSTLGLLASSINHEIKNPLFVIRGLLDGLIEKEAVQSVSAPEREKLLKRIYGQVDRISQVIVRINRLAKDGDTKKNDSFDSAGLSESFRSAAEVVSLVKNGKKVKIFQNIPDALPHIKMTPGELEEIFINLLANAYDAVKSSGEISISAVREKKNIVIKIQDNGGGISSGNMKQIFKPFFTAQKEGGTGLGLYLTKEIIERRGGRIRVKSEPLSGTCFEIEIPAQVC